MKTLVAALMTTLMVFALSMVWSEVVQPGLARVVAISSQPAVKSASRQPTRSAANRAKATDENSDGEQKTMSKESNSNKASNRKDAQQAASSSEPSQLEQVKFEEAKLAERQNTIEMIYRDIFRELEMLKEIRRRSAIELAAAERRAVESTSQQPVTTAVVVTTPVRTAKSPEPKGSTERRMAVLVQGLVDRGNTKAAAAMLAGLKDRESSKVLSLLRDPKTATQLAEQIRTVATAPAERY